MEEVHKKGTWHNEAQIDEVTFEATFDDHQNTLNFQKICFWIFTCDLKIDHIMFALLMSSFF